jgi:hypothetical protein
VAVFLFSTLAGCGKQGDPLPPLRRAPQPVSGLSVAQRGDALEVRFTAPRAYTDAARLPVVEIELLRADREGALEQVAQSSLRRAAPGETLVEQEPLPAPGTTLRFAARARVKKAVSVLATAPPLVVQAPPPAPTGVRAASGAHGVDLAWEAPVPPPPRPVPTPTPAPAATPSPGPATVAASPSPLPAASPSPPVTQPGPVTPSFRVYRRGKDAAYAAPLIAAPTLSPHFEDSTAVQGQRYCYVVRTVVSLDPLIESAPSSEVCVDVVDVSPPPAPEGGAAFAQDDGTVELAWSPLLETDLAGYRVYRKIGQGARERVAELPATDTRWRDALPGGARRVYTLTAFDKAGNESAPSAPIVVERGP